MLVLAAVLLGACGRGGESEQASPPSGSADGAPTAAAPAHAPAPDAAPDPIAVAPWRQLEVEVHPESVPQVLARAERAAEADVLTLYDLDPESAAGTGADGAADAGTDAGPPEPAPDAPALDLYLAVLDLDESEADAQQGVADTLERLLARGRAAMAADRLEEATEVDAVLRGLPPGLVDEEQAEAYASELAEAVELAADTRRAARQRQAGRLLEPEGDNALETLRGVLARAPEHPGAQDELVRLQDALIAEADAAVAADDYALAEQRLAEADRVSPGQQRVQDASVRVVEQRQRRASVLAEEIEQAIQALDLEQAQALLDTYAATSTRATGVNRLRGRIETARRYGHFDAGERFRDELEIGGSGPEMRVVPWGGFDMGSPGGERGRSANEGPQRRVEFERGFAVSMAPITVAEFRRFSEATGYVGTARSSGSSVVYVERAGSMSERPGVDYRHDHAGARAGGDLPVVHVSWLDASAYVDWLSQQSGERYRLPSEAEYEYILRAGSETRFPWGDELPRQVIGNLSGDGDQSPSRRGWSNPFPDYRDGYWGLSPVRRFDPNDFGLYDMVGNVSEWVEDCWHDTYRRAPADGSAWVNPGCARRVVRGASWASPPDESRSAFRLAAPAETTNPRVGFRVVRKI